MVRRLPWLVVAGLLVVLAGLALRPREGPVAGKAPADRLPAAPSFILDTLDGRELHLTQLRGKPVVLNFWASWCAPCRAEMPVLVRAWRRYGHDVHFVGVNVLDDPDEARRFVREFGIPFPSVHDPNGDTLRWFRVLGLPTTVFVSRQGGMAGVHAGPFVGTEGERALERAVREVLER
ncbi:MAG: TlpA family protein disulfide reductase [bacterium]